MRKSARLLCAGSALSLSIFLPFAAADPGDANADVGKLADVVNKPDQLKKAAADLVNKYELRDVAWAFKPRDKGGLGVGATAGALIPDGIELKLLSLEKKPPSAGQLAAQAPDLRRMAEVVRGVAEAMPGFGDKVLKGAGPGRKIIWNGFAADMQKGSDDLITAIKANDPKGMEIAVRVLNKSCVDCHK